MKENEKAVTPKANVNPSLAVIPYTFFPPPKNSSIPLQVSAPFPFPPYSYFFSSNWLTHWPSVKMVEMMTFHRQIQRILARNLM